MCLRRENTNEDDVPAVSVATMLQYATHHESKQGEIGTQEYENTIKLLLNYSILEFWCSVEGDHNVTSRFVCKTLITWYKVYMYVRYQSKHKLSGKSV